MSKRKFLLCILIYIKKYDKRRIIKNLIALAIIHALGMPGHA